MVGFIAPEAGGPTEIDGRPVRVGTANAVEVAHALGAQGVIVATTGLESGAVSNQLLRGLLDGGLHVEMTSGLRDVTPERMTVRPLGRHPVVYLEPARRFGWRAGAKRVFDVVLSTIGLVLVSPVLVAAAIAIKATSRGPVLFRQERLGRDGRSFEVLKLRTMVVDAEDRLVDLLDRNESDGPLFKLQDDPRITKVGTGPAQAVHRRAAAAVERGPGRHEPGRPPARPAPRGRGWTDELHERLRVRPGITGMWQVNGRSGVGLLRVPAPGPVLRGQLVDPHRPRDPPAHHSRPC